MITILERAFKLGKHSRKQVDRSNYITMSAKLYEKYNELNTKPKPKPKPKPKY